MTADSYATVPSSVQHPSGADRTWGVNTAAQLAQGVTPTAVSVTLTSPDGQAVTLADSPAVAGTVISQRIRSGVLTAGPQPYELTVWWTPSDGSTGTTPAVLLVFCPF